MQSDARMMMTLRPVPGASAGAGRCQMTTRAGRLYVAAQFQGLVQPVKLVAQWQGGRVEVLDSHGESGAWKVELEAAGPLPQFLWVVAGARPLLVGALPGSGGYTDAAAQALADRLTEQASRRQRQETPSPTQNAARAALPPDARPATDTQPVEDAQPVTDIRPAAEACPEDTTDLPSGTSPKGQPEGVPERAVSLASKQETADEPSPDACPPEATPADEQAACGDVVCPADTAPDERPPSPPIRRVVLRTRRPAFAPEDLPRVVPLSEPDGANLPGPGHTRVAPEAACPALRESQPPVRLEEVPVVDAPQRETAAQADGAEEMSIEGKAAALAEEAWQAETADVSEAEAGPAVEIDQPVAADGADGQEARSAQALEMEAGERALSAMAETSAPDAALDPAGAQPAVDAPPTDAAAASKAQDAAPAYYPPSDLGPDQLVELLEQGEPISPFCGQLPGAKFVRIVCGPPMDHYLVGSIPLGQQGGFYLVGVPAHDGWQPPSHMPEFRHYLPAKEGPGYWIRYTSILPAKG